MVPYLNMSRWLLNYTCVLQCSHGNIKEKNSIWRAVFLQDSSEILMSLTWRTEENEAVMLNGLQFEFTEKDIKNPISKIPFL